LNVDVREFVFQSKKSSAELAIDLLPPPIEFTEQMVGDTKMMVAVASDKSTFWLEPDSYERVTEFLDSAADIKVGISRLVNVPEALLVLVGPVKCSKSTMLDIIPCILSQRYHMSVAAGRTPRLPVALKWDISPTDVPFDALIKLLRSIEDLALALGIKFQFGTTFSSYSDLLVSTHKMFCGLAKEAAKRNMCVWLYVDEVQVPNSHFCIRIRCIVVC